MSYKERKKIILKKNSLSHAPAGIAHMFAMIVLLALAHLSVVWLVQ